MAKYEVVIRRSVYKDLRSVPKADVKKILTRIESLAEDPRGPGCEKLSADERYRVRQGNYRIIYSIEDDRLIVIVVKVGHRRDVYER
ncbi:MAG TPA: type II toxin-antitoxin system RelE/ParE family toxin [Pyrinomonadaceae bacterium]|jgi:mRNA interferase RelE/StbE|nr:type II toxin-antitoxin system RelE/ParE family toxin [Pyrinomonadaceae bacterium]